MHPRGIGIHKRRPSLSRHTPVHVTLRLATAVGNARRRAVYQAIRAATFCVFRHDPSVKPRRFRIVHFSIQRDHVHAIVEAHDRIALARGLQGFQISAARHINRRACGGRRGTVFPHRYHARYLTTPRQVRHALAYVLNNWRHHGEDRRAPRWPIDPYSSAIAFLDYRERRVWIHGYDPPRAFALTEVADSWLLREGWRRHGRISIYEIPGD